MKQVIIFFFSFCSIMLNGCCGNGIITELDYTDPIDSLLHTGGTRYDVANYLLNNPGYAETEIVDNEFHRCLQSQDVRVRIFSIFERCDEYDNMIFSNIAHFKNSDSVMNVKCDLDFNKKIHQIGVRDTPSRTYYLFISKGIVSELDDWFHYSINIYYIDKGNGVELKPAAILKTKDGRMLHSIEVNWNDHGWAYTDFDGLWGITLDSETVTDKIYIQLVDKFERCHNEALVYKWDGRCYSYERQEPAYFKD